MMNPTETVNKITNTVLRNLEKRNRLELALGATALQGLRAHQKAEIDRVTAEDKAAHRALFGEEAKPEGDSMSGDVILGDYSTYQPPPNPPSPFGKYAGMALVGASLLGPLVWLGSKYLDRPVSETPPTVEDTDTVTELKILRDES